MTLTHFFRSLQPEACAASSLGPVDGPADLTGQQAALHVVLSFQFYLPYPCQFPGESEVLCPLKPPVLSAPANRGSSTIPLIGTLLLLPQSQPRPACVLSGAPPLSRGPQATAQRDTPRAPLAGKVAICKPRPWLPAGTFKGRGGFASGSASGGPEQAHGGTCVCWQVWTGFS